METFWYKILSYGIALLFAPLLMGIIPRVKAMFAGRQGPPLLQVYYDLIRLLRKGAVYSVTTSWVFPLAPMVSLTAILLALSLIPHFGIPAIFYFSADIILFAYLFAMVRFFTILGAMDTGSSFEGMGASREAIFSLLSEPIFFLCLATLIKRSHQISFSSIIPISSLSNGNALSSILDPVLLLILCCLFVVLLVENYRIPIDDPNTHLELTMIHEVMVLDNSGPDFAFILYASSLKFWIFASLLSQLLIPRLQNFWLEKFYIVLAMGAIAVLVGIIESLIARLRLVWIPRLLVGTTMLALLAFLLVR